MELTNAQLAKATSLVLDKITFELKKANRNNEIERYLDEYNIVLEDEERIPINIRTCKILVMGELNGKQKDFELAAKKIGLNHTCFEFVDYNEAKKFNAARLEFSNEYSDIIYGPTPHKMSGMGNTSSLLALIQNNPANYPRLLRSEANSTSCELKISISSFKKCLLKTFYYETMCKELA